MESTEPLNLTANLSPVRACILLVDDDPASLASLRAILGDLGYDLVEARSGEEALDRAKGRQFAVILLDVRLPGLNGFDTAVAIRADERSRSTPIIFQAEDGIDRDQIERGYALGAVDVLVKPPSPVVVRAKVRGLVTLYQEERRARHEADQLRLLVHGTTDYAIFMLDPEGRVATWNPGAERIKGYPAGEIIGQHFSRFYPQDAVERGWPDHELKVAAAEGRFEDEGWRLRKDGSRFWANVVITALRDERGRLQGFSKITRDLTERMQAEESLRRSEERFRHMIEGVHDYAIFMLDPNGHVATWNAGAERIKQYKAEEIIGQHFSKFYPQEALDRGWPAHELKVAEAEGRFEDEGWRVRKDGSLFWANVVITALKDGRGRLLGFSKITRDLTARKQAEEVARRLAEETAARRAAEETARLVQQERGRLQVTLASIGDAVISTDAQGRVAFLNPVAEELVGWRSGEAAGRTLEDVFRIVNEATRRPVENPALRALRDGKIVGLANHTVLISKDGTERPIDDSAAPIRNERGDISGSVLVFRDITERRRNEAALAERMRLLALNASVGEALVQGDGLGAMLRRCAAAMVEHLDGAFARIWTLNEDEGVLELRASAGLYTHLGGPHGRVPVGEYKIGLIAQERRPHLTNSVVGDPRVSDREWAEREGMVAFAGYPLLVDGRLVGVMAMFARHELTGATLEAMASVADEIAVGIERKSAQERLDEQREWLSVTLASIGDAVIATDDRGRVTFLNGVAQELTGWAQVDAVGRPLEAVFVILHEQTRQPVENPVGTVLREGVIVGLGNHTVLVARDGSERPIDDSAAPIRDSAGGLIGVVLIFRDVAEQRRSERELRASEARKGAILETALDAIITMDHEGRVVEFNPAAERVFGFRREALIGDDLAEFIIPPSLREKHRNGMAHYLATGQGPVLGRRLELPALRADGTEFPVELAIARISHDGPPLFTAYLRDITERKRAERQRDARLAVTHALTVAATADDGAAGVLEAVCDNLGWDLGFLWTVNEGGSALVCRTSWHRPDVSATKFERASCGRTFARGEGLPGRVWATAQPAWILDVGSDANFPRVAPAAEEGLHSAFACPILVGDRPLGVIEFFCHRTEEPDPGLLEMMGTVAGSLGHFIVRKEVEDELRRSEQELADFFDNATVGLHWVGPDGIILRANQAELDMLGYGREEYIGRPIADFHADRDVICDILGRLKAGERLVEYPARLRCKDGSIKDVLIDSSVLWRGGKFVHTRCFTRDVSERRRHEEERERLLAEAEAANQAKTQFLAVLSHELRTPLNPILLAASSMLERPAEPREIRPTMEMIRQNVNLQARLIDDLLDVMRIVRGKMPLHWEVADGHKIIDQAVQVCRSEVLGKRLQLEAGLAAAHRHVNADPARLQQVFWNLIKNAVKFTPEGGSIAVRTRNEAGDDGDRLVVEVNDTGIGIEPDVLPTIFDPFQQGETTITRKFGGLGLGLAICKGIVEAHGGTIVAESGGPGRGTTFRVALKALPEPVDEPSGQPLGGPVVAEPARPTSLRILVVEDEPATLRLMARLLRGLGHEVETAGTIASGLEAVEGGQFDLIVSDIGLPDGSGLELMRRAVARRGPVPGIALTGYGMEEDIRRSREAGFTAHLTKPIDFAKLEAMIRQVAG